jgi:hypothetical protein
MSYPDPLSRNRPHGDRAAVRLLALLSCAAIVLGAAACGGGGGGASPTDPGMPAASGTASITGQVSVTGSSGGSLTTGPTVATGAVPGAPSHQSPADSTGSGMTVRVQGTNLSTTTDASGQFGFQNVPSGNQVLVFERAASSASVPIASIQPAERIQISVQVSGSSVSVTDIQRSGGSDQGGTGGGDQGGGGGTGTEPPPPPPQVDLSLQISPDSWNLNYDHSQGTVTAFLRGTGFDQVVLDSILLLGDNADAEPLAPVSATRQGDHARAQFAKNMVLGLLDMPTSGSMHTVTLQFEIDGQDGTSELTADVTIEGQDGSGDGGQELGDLSLQIDPDSWNLNYDQSSGSVTAFIRGTGLDAIDTDSIELSGDNADAEPLPATTARLEGDHLRAQFPKSMVLGLLDMPTSGSEHTVTVSFTANDGADQLQLQDDVKIVGKDKSGDDSGGDGS